MMSKRRAGTAAGLYLVYLTKNDMSQKIADINAANNAAAANRAHERFLKDNMLRDMGWREDGWDKWNKVKKGLVTATEIGDNLTSGQIFPNLWEGTKQPSHLRNPASVD